MQGLSTFGVSGRKQQKEIETTKDKFLKKSDHVLILYGLMDEGHH